MRRPRAAAIALAAWAALLQACAAPHTGVEEPAPPVAAAAASAPGPAAGFVPASLRPANLAPTSPGPAAVAPPRQAAARPLPAALAGRSPRAARDLAGLTDGQLVAVMGEPDLRRTEDGAEAWLYRGPTCLLDVFLEAEGAGAEPRVVLAAARPAGGAAGPVAEEACLRALARARAGLRSPFLP